MEISQPTLSLGFNTWLSSLYIYTTFKIDLIEIKKKYTQVPIYDNEG